jgi:deoxyribodipyrimidine photolyase-related protein
LGVLLNPDGSPEGGRWSFDTENRKKLPAGIIPPPVTYTSGQPWLAEAAQYVATHFPHAPGSSQGPYLFAVTHQSAADALQQFLHQRLVHFGVYEDAIASGYTTLFHSVLTPMLNTGLLTPQQVVDATLAHAAQHAIPLNSLEGFIRQVIGWREFVRLVYLQQGRRQRTTNFWGFTRRIPASFYNGTTGIPPIDNTIRKVLKTGYCHHIERLMVLGNFMLLCEFHPHDVYKWFMEMFIDAYDWVMVPNVYGMSQFADGGLMTTKPYISGSNYIMKMSDYKAGPWQQVWDGLFWRFMHRHSTFFLSNPRLGMLVHTFNKMPQEKQQAHLAHAERFLQSLG